MIRWLIFLKMISILYYFNILILIFNLNKKNIFVNINT